MVPTDAAGRVVARALPAGVLPLLTAAGKQQLRDEIVTYDAEGGYANANAMVT